MKRLVVLLGATATLGASAAPAYGIHDSTLTPGPAQCASSTAAIGIPAASHLVNDAGQAVPDPGNSEQGLAHNAAQPKC